MAQRKERIFNCPDCGVEVRTRYGTRKFCEACAERRRKESIKRAEARRQERKKAERREKAINEVKTVEHADEFYFHDSPENIQKCLNCTRTKCNDCLSLLVSSKGVKDDG